MNCVNHPEAAATAYCQNCGKPLCSACVRTVQGNIFCEPCLAARVTGAPAGFPPPGVTPSGPGPNPGTAAILGFIPGVGAMYNGQYVKALIHVLVFVVLISITQHYGLFGIFVGLWVLYQVFDAHQTAKARREGLPLPDPFGLNELGNRIGGQAPPAPGFVPPVPPVGAPGTPPPPPVGSPDWTEQVHRQAREWSQQAGEWGENLRQRIVNESTQAGQPYQPGQPYQSGPQYQSGQYWQGAAPWGAAPGYGVPPAGGPVAGAVPPTGAGYPPPPPGWTPVGAVPPGVPPPIELERARREPIGAIVLIVLGMLFLLNTLGFFSFSWINHGWPWVIVAIAVWLLVRNGAGRHMFGPPPPVPPAPEPPQAPSPNPSQPPAGGAL